MLAYQRELFTDCQQRLGLGEDRRVPQEPVLVVCTVVVDHVQRKVQDPVLSALPQLIDMGGVVLIHSCRFRLVAAWLLGLGAQARPLSCESSWFHARWAARAHLRDPTSDEVRNVSQA